MAKTATRTRTRGSNLPVPQTTTQVAEAIYRIGEIDRLLQKQDADLKEALAKVKRTYEEAAEPFKQEQAGLVEGVKIFCEANRQTLTDAGKSKTVPFTTGHVRWRLRPPSVKLPRDIGGVIAAIKARGLIQFLRLTEDVSKEAMLAEPVLASSIPGVRIASEGEDFAVEPFTPDGIAGRAA